MLIISQIEGGFGKVYTFDDISVEMFIYKSCFRCSCWLIQNYMNFVYLYNYHTKNFRIKAAWKIKYEKINREKI